TFVPLSVRCVRSSFTLPSVRSSGVRGRAPALGARGLSPPDSQRRLRLRPAPDLEGQLADLARRVAVRVALVPRALALGDALPVAPPRPERRQADAGVLRRAVLDLRRAGHVGLL